MKITDVTENDGVMCASLMQILAVSDKLFDALKLAGLPVSGPGMDKRNEAAKWLRDISRPMADQLRDAAKAKENQIKVTAMGPISGSTSTKKSRKKA